MATKLPDSINLLESVGAPADVWEKMYDWIFTVGQYLLVIVEAVVLIVFVTRFTLDTRNNNLSDDINFLVSELENETNKTNEARFNTLNGLLLDIEELVVEQKINSIIIDSIIDEIPNDIVFKSFSFSDAGVSMNFEAQDFDAINSYETTLKNNPLYEQVNLGLNKSVDDDAIQFSVNFKIAEEGDE